MDKPNNQPTTLDIHVSIGIHGLQVSSTIRKKIYQYYCYYYCYYYYYYYIRFSFNRPIFSGDHSRLGKIPEEPYGDC